MAGHPSFLPFEPDFGGFATVSDWGHIWLNPKNYPEITQFFCVRSELLMLRSVPKNTTRSTMSITRPAGRALPVHPLLVKGFLTWLVYAGTGLISLALSKPTNIVTSSGIVGNRMLVG